MTESRTCEELLTEAVGRRIEGWDFGWIQANGRLVEQPLPWNYRTVAQRKADEYPDLLDLGTGGGELLSSLQRIPTRAVATETYLPNARIAARRLSPLGIQVVHTQAAPDNNRQGGSSSVPSLPFRDGSFHLILDRNEAFVASEVARVLAPTGTFLTEQSGGVEFTALQRLFDLPDPDPGPTWDLVAGRDQVEAAGLQVASCQEARVEMIFRDVGALVWYLRMVPWAAPGFSLPLHRRHLEELHRMTVRGGLIRIPRYAFWLEARK